MSETTQDTRGSRRTILGTVTSTKMDKTAVITVIRRVRDRRFHKFLTNRVTYHVHDEDNSYSWSASPLGLAADGNAFATCLRTLNSGGCFAGQCDWRLPTIPAVGLKLNRDELVATEKSTPEIV